MDALRKGGTKRCRLTAVSQVSSSGGYPFHLTLYKSWTRAHPTGPRTWQKRPTCSQPIPTENQAVAHRQTIMPVGYDVFDLVLILLHWRPLLPCAKTQLQLPPLRAPRIRLGFKRKNGTLLPSPKDSPPVQPQGILGARLRSLPGDSPESHPEPASTQTHPFRYYTQVNTDRTPRIPGKFGRRERPEASAQPVGTAERR